MDITLKQFLLNCARHRFAPIVFHITILHKKQSSISYQARIDNPYNAAVSELYELNGNQRNIVIKRIDEVRELQKYFDVPTKETVNALLREITTHSSKGSAINPFSTITYTANLYQSA